MVYKAVLAVLKPDRYKEFSTFNKGLLYLGGKRGMTDFEKHSLVTASYRVVVGLKE